MPDSRVPGSPPWWVIVPVRDTRHGKSRLAVDPALRVRLARALAGDTVAAAAGCQLVGAVLAVVDTPADADLLRSAGARALLGHFADLGAAVAAGLAQVPTGTPVAVLLGDVPALRSGELADVLAAVPAGGTVFVTDAAGTGTTLVAGRGVPVRPLFGPGSAAAHRAAGMLDLVATAAVPASLRQDIDTVADLATASPLLSEHSWTRRVLREAAAPPDR